MPAKRAASTDAHRASPHQPMESHTTRVLSLLRREYRLALPESHFVTLCAYLCALLRAGLTATECDLDPFVVRYHEFAAALPNLEGEAIDTATVEIPSYHEWLRRSPRTPCTGVHVLTEAGLRRVWEEHRWSFLVVYFRLQVLAGG